MASEQSFEHHTALDPITHFTLLPLFLLTLGYSIYLLSHDWPLNRPEHVWMVAVSVGLILLNVKSRVYPLKVQDRIIRLETRQRLLALLPQYQHATIEKLTTRQIVALRFAPDAELPTLALRAAAEDLPGKEIKASIKAWRADHHRI